METTIVALATPPGAGGIAVVRLSGPESYRITEQVFRPVNPNKKVSEAKGYTALFGHFIARDETLDEGVALFFRAPRSYTGEDVVELSCHGGMVIAQELITACIAAGAVSLYLRSTFGMCSLLVAAYVCIAGRIVFAGAFDCARLPRPKSRSGGGQNNFL